MDQLHPDSIQLDKKIFLKTVKQFVPSKGVSINGCRMEHLANIVKCGGTNALFDARSRIANGSLPDKSLRWITAGKRIALLKPDNS